MFLEKKIWGSEEEQDFSSSASKDYIISIIFRCEAEKYLGVFIKKTF